MVWGFLPNWTPRLLWHKFWTRSPGSSEPRISGIVSAAKPFYYSPVFTLNFSTEREDRKFQCVPLSNCMDFFLFSKQLCWHRNRPISQPLARWRLVFYYLLKRWFYECLHFFHIRINFQGWALPIIYY